MAHNSRTVPPSTEQRLVAAIFSDAKFGRETSFNSCCIIGDANFERVTFSQRTSMSFATFRSRAIFAGATVTDGDFRGARFEGSSSFYEARFEGTTNCIPAYFETVSFSGTSFGGTAIFANVNFGGADFRNVAFGANASFGDAAFATNPEFTKASFAADAHFNLKDGGGTTIDLAGSSFSGLTRPTTNVPLGLASIVVKEPLTVGSGRVGNAAISSLQHSTLEAPLIISDGVSLADCQLSNATGLSNLRVLDKGVWAINRRRRVLADALILAEKGTPDQIATVENSYRQLRAALEASKDYAGAADFYYGEMEMRLRGAERWSVERWLLWGYKWLAGYGLSAYRALGTYVFVVFFFRDPSPRGYSQPRYLRGGTEPRRLARAGCRRERCRSGTSGRKRRAALQPVLGLRGR